MSSKILANSVRSNFTTYFIGVLLIMLCSHNVHAQNIVNVKEGALQGVFNKDKNLHMFKGVPFAAAPIGELRWQAPQAHAKWQSVRQATEFNNQCVQPPLYDDMKFRAKGMSEDCLYLNIWTPTLAPKKAMPVLLYFYGGGFAAGDGSEPRYDGASMAQNDIVVITANYRLGIFGLFSHPELSAQSGYSGSGNYTFMDQAAALKWVAENIAAFGGDANRITIAGESAGSMSVNALMASPLSKQYIAGAIGESGSLLGPTLGTITLKEAEKNGANLASALGQASPNKTTQALTIAELRKISASELLEKSIQAGFQWFLPTVDGYVFPQSPLHLYRQNHFAKIPLLTGNNSQESSYKAIMSGTNLTLKAYKQALKNLYPTRHEQIFKLYPATTIEEIKESAQALASDRFISFSTWYWANLVATKLPTKVFYYEFSKIRPPSIQSPKGEPSSERGAVHSAEIEYALGNLNTHPVYQWQNDDYTVSRIMQSYFVNFIKTGNPNGSNLPDWPLFSDGKQLDINVETKAENIEELWPRYRFHRDYFQIK